MDFETLEKKIEELNKINTKATPYPPKKYYILYDSIYESLLEMEKDGSIIIDPDEKNLSYLRELLENDGPEFCYRFVFRGKNSAKKYVIGVCIRGLPMCKPVDQ